MAGAISQPRQSCQFLFCLMKNPLLYRSAWPESSREASERFLMETLGRTQSERCRRLALAGGFRLLRSSGIDRLDAPAHGSAGPDDCEISNIMSDPSFLNRNASKPTPSNIVVPGSGAVTSAANPPNHRGEPPNRRKCWS